MKAINIRDIKLKESILAKDSVVGYCNARIERYLERKTDGGCPLYEAELTFNYLYNELCTKHTEIIELASKSELKNITKCYVEIYPHIKPSNEDACFIIVDCHLKCKANGNSLL